MLAFQRVWFVLEQLNQFLPFRFSVFQKCDYFGSWKRASMGTRTFASKCSK